MAPGGSGGFSIVRAGYILSLAMQQVSAAAHARCGGAALPLTCPAESG